MFSTRLNQFTAYAMTVTLLSLAAIGHLIHDESCSAACEVAKAEPTKVVSHTGCSHGHSHAPAPTPEEPTDDGDSHDDGECAVCVFLSHCSPTVALVDVPRFDDIVETALQPACSDAIRTCQSSTSPRGPPA